MAVPCRRGERGPEPQLSPPARALRGCPPAYADLDAVLDPPSPRSPNLFLPRILGSIVQPGVPALTNAIAVGQHEYWFGLFFGGRTPASSTRIIQREFQDWFRGAASVLHVDPHAGSAKGASGSCWWRRPRIRPASPWHWERLRGLFVQSSSAAGGVAFAARGATRTWLDHPPESGTTAPWRPSSERATCSGCCWHFARRTDRTCTTGRNNRPTSPPRRYCGSAAVRPVWPGASGCLSMG